MKGSGKAKKMQWEGRGKAVERPKETAVKRPRKGRGKVNERQWKAKDRQ